MKNNALFKAETHELSPTAGWLKTLRRNWMARREVRKLADLDDWVLQDIGVTRAEIAWASQLPLDRDPAKALERHARIRHESQL